MSPVAPLQSRRLAFATALFILSFYIFFSYSGLFAPFNFDDGTTVIACLRPFDTPVWRDLLNILKVFTNAFRPLTTMFWRPLYHVFGFNPLPFRITVHLLLGLNIGLAYVLARRLEMSREAAALSALIFCYNAATNALYYNTCLIGDILSFSLYALAFIVYAGVRQTGYPLGWRSTAAVLACYMLALDSKELAVTLPGILVIYEALYRRHDYHDRRTALRTGGLLLLMFIAGSIYLKIKIADMSQNVNYKPHVSILFLLQNTGQYLQQLLYLPENSVGAAKGCLILSGLIGLGVLVRSRPAIFGVLFFGAALIPVAAIDSRGGYAAYGPWFGLAIALGGIVAGARSQIIRLTRQKRLETATMVAVFLCSAFLLGWAHMVRRMAGNGYFEWSKPPLVYFLDGFRHAVPDFPPGARVLVAKDPFEPDWGPMFLIRLMYHDKFVWVDRPNMMEGKPDITSYDLVVSYKPPDVDLVPARLFGVPMKWEIRGKAINSGQFTATSPNAHGAAGHLEFSPQAVRSGQTTTVTMPGLSNVTVNVLYRIVSGTRTSKYVVYNWCTLDAKGTCSVTAPAAEKLGAMVIDWVQPANQRWIFTTGILSIVE